MLDLLLSSFHNTSEELSFMPLISCLYYMPTLLRSRIFCNVLDLTFSNLFISRCFGQYISNPYKHDHTSSYQKTLCSSRLEIQCACPGSQFIRFFFSVLLLVVLLQLLLYWSSVLSIPFLNLYHSTSFTFTCTANMRTLFSYGFAQRITILRPLTDLCPSTYIPLPN